MQRLWREDAEIESESQRLGTTDSELPELDKEIGERTGLEELGSTGTIIWSERAEETVRKWERGNMNGKMDRREKDRQRRIERIRRKGKFRGKGSIKLDRKQDQDI